MVSGDSQSASFAAISPVAKSLRHIAHEGMEDVSVEAAEKTPMPIVLRLSKSALNRLTGTGVLEWWSDGFETPILQYSVTPIPHFVRAPPLCVV
jgi:hypothetical protein